MSIDLGMPSSGVAFVPQLAEGSPALGRKDYTSDQDVRWCPGCGDYAILAAMQGFLPELGLRKENIVFISGIGCSSRFPYYLDTYGLHSIHGRAPTFATGLATAREDLSVWVITGDGDAERKHLTEVLHAAAAHRGAALVEIYQNCPIFNDGAFDVLKDKDEAAARILWLKDGEEVATGDRVAVRADDGSIQVVPRAEASPTRIVRHSVDTEHPSSAFALSRLTSDGLLAHVPMGVFRDVSRPTYDDMVRGQVSAAVEAAGGPATDADLAALLAGRDTWTVGG